MTYVLPRRMRDALDIDLIGLRNAWAALLLARIVAQAHTGPRVRGRSFTLCRRGLAAAYGDLGLTEEIVRGAIRVLERIGFIVRDPAPEKPCRRTATGWQRKPIVWRIATRFLALCPLLKRRPAAAVPRPPYTPQAIAVALMGEDRNSPFEAAVARLRSAMGIRGDGPQIVPGGA